LLWQKDFLQPFV
jgi:hypothetical protein